jgi:hypothetical protein
MTTNLRTSIIGYRNYLIYQLEIKFDLTTIDTEYIKRGYPYFKINYADSLEDRRQWCIENISKRDWDCVGNSIFFTKDEDALAFKLTWI